MSRRTSFFWLLLLFAFTTVCATQEPTADELAQYRRKLEVWRTKPEQLARLRQNLQTFLALPVERRDQIIKLDQDLHQQAKATQKRLEGVMERYTNWLDRLPETYRQAIKQALDRTARLALIRELRDEMWIRSRPRTVREDYAKLPADRRRAFVADLRLKARQEHQEWQIASKFWQELEGKKPMPCRLSDFSPSVQKYVNEYLMTLLLEKEKKELASAEGRWPDYPRTLVAIASNYPSALPPKNKELPRHLDQLPAPIRQRVSVEKKGGTKKKVLAELVALDNRPGFASKVVELGTNKGIRPFEYEFWACNYKSLLPPMRNFVDQTLQPMLKDNADKKKLSENEGHWPWYPLTIQELAEKYHLHPPWHILPDAHLYKWDGYRPTKYQPLHDFLNDAERR